MLEMATLKGWNLLMAAKDVTSTRVWGLLEEPQPPLPQPPPHTRGAGGGTHGVLVTPYLAESRVPSVQ